jgi:hypothetical protein
MPAEPLLSGAAQSDKSVITTILRNGFGPICGCVKSNSEQRASFARGRATAPRKLRLATSLPSSAPAIKRSTPSFSAAVTMALAGSPSFHSR